MEGFMIWMLTLMVSITGYQITKAIKELNETIKNKK